MDQPNTKYYWSIYAEDSKGNTVEHIYHFTTAQIVPLITNPLPLDDAKGIPVNLSMLKFNLTDLQNDLMDWTVETIPDIGSGFGNNVGNGQYTVSISSLSSNTTYTWFVNVTDGTNWKHETFTFTTRPTLGTWWDTSWTYRKEILIDNTQVIGTHANFPLVIKLPANDDLYYHAQADGDDIVFTDYNGNKLNHEIELYNDSTGELIVWVNIPTLSSAELTILYLYYGNPTCSNQQNPTGTWNTNYLMVQHLDETTGTHFDSTINDNDGTPNGGVTQHTTGYFNGGDMFDGINDYIDLAGTTDFNKQDITVGTWIKTTKDTTDMRIIVGGATYTYKWHLIMDDGHLMMTNNTIANANLRTTELYNDGEWHYVVGIRNPLRLYVDGHLVSAQPVAETWSLDGGAKIGAKSSTQYFFNGSMDETRVYNGSLTSDWIQTEYNNYHDPSGFYTIGSEESEAPHLSEAYPSNNATNIPLNPTVSITVFDAEGDDMDVYFRTNASGTWATIGSNLSVDNGTYAQSTSDMDAYLTTYYWSVNCT